MTLKLLVRLDQVVYDSTGAQLGISGDQLARDSDLAPGDLDKVAVFDDASEPLDMGHYHIHP
jgi:hypothetical protein